MGWPAYIQINRIFTNNKTCYSNDLATCKSLTSGSKQCYPWLSTRTCVQRVLNQIQTHMKISSTDIQALIMAYQSVYYWCSNVEQPAQAVWVEQK